MSLNNTTANNTSSTNTTMDTKLVSNLANGVQQPQQQQQQDEHQANGSIKSNALNCIQAEFNKLGSRNSWQRFYQEIHEKCDREAKNQNFNKSESERPQNRCLNRYRDVNPYDHSRIVLHRGTVDYINANLVKLERAERKYILTQGPLPETVGHFWLMVWEQKSRAILMLNKLVEKKQVKCHQYWPEQEGKTFTLKDVKLTVEFVRQEQYNNYVRRWLKLTDLETQTSRDIMQFHYTTWPDFGIPSSPNAFLQFLKQVRDSGALNADVGPAVVHCSAGIGRSGTFCLVDCCLVLVDKHDECDLPKVLCELRSYRMGLIQTSDQLYFSYQAIIEGIKLLKDPSFLDYKEEPLNNNGGDAQTQEQYNLDETPPPLPPRTDSLNLPMAPSTGGVLSLNLHGKPLPALPADQNNDASLIPLVAAAGDTCTQQERTDALKNFIDNEINGLYVEVAETLLTNRPLPPLPSQVHNNLNAVKHGQESDSDSEEMLDYDEDDSYDEDNDNVNEQKHLAHTTTDNNEQNKKHNRHNHDDMNAKFGKIATVTSATVTAEQQQHTGNIQKLNGIESNSNNSTLSSPDIELKRRKRNEYQASLEKKINDIKKKQREAEEGKQAAKKRRSLLTYIAAGVVVGVIAVYAYTKLS